jgi:hypothetical protein
MLDQLLDAGLQIGTLLLMSLGGYAVKRGADWLKLSSDSQVRAYLNTVPDALARFGIGTADLDAMIRARMPKPSFQANG